MVFDHMNIDRDIASKGLKEVLEVVETMLQQEVTIYRRSDFLASNGALSEVVDAEWRQRIIEWMYGVIDHCSLRRDSVAVASVYLDLVTERGLVAARQEYQIAAMTCLQLAIKLYDSTMVKLDSMVKLGRGLFTEEDVVRMEQKILFALGWQVHPPTAVCYLRQFVPLLPVDAQYLTCEMARFILEVSICLYKFVRYPPSVVAYAGVLIALQDRQEAMDRLNCVVGLNAKNPLVQQVAFELRRALEKNISLQDLVDSIDAQCQADSDMPSKNMFAAPAPMNSPRAVVRSKRRE